ncbi:MAG TPA: S-layer homology domain-containing protein [Syntrophomonadaceae bacterium]|nr:S-layer homology domain-containing protein [Syntrophomonadaceae bacterium]
MAGRLLHYRRQFKDVNAGDWYWAVNAAVAANLVSGTGDKQFALMPWSQLTSAEYNSRE